MMRPVTNPDLEAQMGVFQQAILDRDVAAAELVLDDDFALVLVHPASATVSRAKWLDTLPVYDVHQYDVEECTIDVASDGATASVLHRADMACHVDGVDRSGKFVITDVWRRRPDGWRVWRRHSTPLNAAPLPPALS